MRGYYTVFDMDNAKIGLTVAVDSEEENATLGISKWWLALVVLESLLLGF